jgi:hypothetical protein
VTQETTREAGLPAYEISNHARPGAESRHNLVYWRYGEYAGIGPGAHGRLDTPEGRRATAVERGPEAWLNLVEAQGHGIIVDEGLSRMEQSDEYLLMGLRLAEGIDRHRFARLSGRDFEPARVAALLAERMIEELPDGRLRVTPQGFPVLGRHRGRSGGVIPSFTRPSRPGMTTFGIQSPAPALKLRGAGSSTLAPPGCTCMMARPRWLVPSLLKRKMPSTPEKPAGLWIAWSEMPPGPCDFTIAAISETASCASAAVRTGSRP